MHETERAVFPIPQVFGMCRRRLRHKTIDNPEDRDWKRQLKYDDEL